MFPAIPFDIHSVDYTMSPQIKSRADLLAGVHNVVCSCMAEQARSTTTPIILAFTITYTSLDMLLLQICCYFRYVVISAAMGSS